MLLSGADVALAWQASSALALLLAHHLRQSPASKVMGGDSE